MTTLFAFTHGLQQTREDYAAEQEKLAKETIKRDNEYLAWFRATARQPWEQPAIPVGVRAD
jgi:hypothetical protein